ncbi:MAG: type II toxin-antitoxin system RelB/DinJ family antitoxin, partial [Campylobacter sp.]|nr:type II toxin-antitoxin system RelB/DinJ family antitoxin [Campylobacter sp.]
LGIPMSNAVSMFLRQVVLQRGIPFEMKLPKAEPLAFAALTKEQFDSEIERGMQNVKEVSVVGSLALESKICSTRLIISSLKALFVESII